MSNVVYVVDKHGKPLMPTKRFGKVRHLFKTGKAVAISNCPFTIRLKYESTHYTQDIYVGIDTDRENIGSGASKEDGTNVYLANTKTHNKSIKKQMSDRACFRRERRRYHRQKKQRKAVSDGNTIQNGDDDTVCTKHACKSVQISYPMAENAVTHKVIRGKEGKFANRKRPDGWITPSARQVVQVTVNELKSITKILPVTHMIMERVSFDFQKLENESIKAWEYGKGPLCGYKTYKDYIFDEQHGKCACCGKPITQYHHIVHRTNGGIDSVKNIIGLCDDCHEEIHTSINAEERLKELKAGVIQKYHVGLLNSVMPALIEEMAIYCEEQGIVFAITDGKTTSKAREQYDIPKDHCFDAYAISLADRDVENIDIYDIIYQKRRFKKKSNNIINARNKRAYKLDGKVVAYNRHKATDQKDDSLEEFFVKYRDNHSEKEVQQMMHNIKIEPAKRTYTFHKTGQIAPIHPGDVVRYVKHNKIRGNTKTEMLVADNVNMSKDGRVGYGTKNKKLKYCKRIASGCVQIIDVIKAKEHITK